MLDLGLLGVRFASPHDFAAELDEHHRQFIEQASTGRAKCREEQRIAPCRHVFAQLPSLQPLRLVGPLRDFCFRVRIPAIVNALSTRS